MRIVQIAPEIGPGTGVGGVAHHLEQEWLRRGVVVERFTMADAHGGWLPHASGGAWGRLALAARVVWFSTIGTVLARRLLRRLRRKDPGTIAVCHNDVLAGEIYVNHGIVQAAMRARGLYWLRMSRNPLHLFTSARDRARYAGRAGHRVVVNLVEAEEEVLRTTYPQLSVPTVVIGNGVDVAAFRPDDGERALRRAELGLGHSDHVLLFVGHEYARKGLHLAVEALVSLPDDTHLIVVGGSESMTARSEAAAAEKGVKARVHHVGAQADPRPWFHAADVFVLPSAYESYGLVVLEALACGLPVVATSTGCVPDVITPGSNGYVVSPRPRDISEAVAQLRRVPSAQLRTSARATAEEHSWSRVADQYLDVIDGLVHPISTEPAP